MQKINDFIINLLGEGIEPEAVLHEIATAIFYTGLGITLTGAYLLSNVWLLGAIALITGFIVKSYYSRKNLKRTRKIKK